MAAKWKLEAEKQYKHRSAQKNDLSRGHRDYSIFALRSFLQGKAEETSLSNFYMYKMRLESWQRVKGQ